MRARHRLAAVSIMLLVTVVACALPTDDSAQVVTGEEVENAMQPTTTSTTQAVGGTASRGLYFFNDKELLEESPIEVPLETDIADLLTMLAQPPAETERTILPEDFVVTRTELDDGVLTVVLADDTLFQLGGSEAARAVAQIVMTATRLQGEGITRVQFELDDEPREVLAGPDLTTTDEPVDACDYRQFLPADIPCANPN